METVCPGTGASPYWKFSIIITVEDFPSSGSTVHVSSGLTSAWKTVERRDRADRSRPEIQVAQLRPR